jgi:hypothetical protein
MTVAGARGRAELADPADGPRVVLDAPDCAAGETLTGRVAGARAGDSVVLVRVERRPRGERGFAVARADAAGPDGAFAIAVPDGALPTAAGSRCGLSYCVDSAAGAAAAVAIHSGARPHLDEGRCRIDRLIPNWDARRFHIEVSDAALEGGGRIAGRVHRHGPWRAGTMTIDVSCRESWRLPTRSARGVPGWGAGWLWRHIERLEVEPDATWIPFDLPLPALLPPAVEARTIAWRYEIVVRRRARSGLAETAARTLLLHEESALAWVER